MKREFSAKHRTLIDVCLIVCFLLTAALTGSYLAYYSFILLPVAGALGDFRMTHKSTLPIISVLMGYWVAYIMNAADGPMFYAILYGVLCGFGALMGIFIDRTVFSKDKKKGKKIVGVAVSAFVALVLMVATFQYVGNPISMFVSTTKANKYVNTEYPDEDYKVTYSFYDMATGSYICTVSDEEGNALFDIAVTKGEVSVQEAVE